MHNTTPMLAQDMAAVWCGMVCGAVAWCDVVWSDVVWCVCLLLWLTCSVCGTPCSSDADSMASLLLYSPVELPTGNSSLPDTTGTRNHQQQHEQQAKRADEASNTGSGGNSKSILEDTAGLVQAAQRPWAHSNTQHTRQCCICLVKTVQKCLMHLHAELTTVALQPSS